MLSIKALVATGAIVTSTIGGAYATGVVNKNGHPVDDHAAHGQAVAAAARAKHEASTTPSAEPTTTTTTEAAESEPSETATTDPAGSATTEPADTTEPTTTASPTQHLGWTQGKHVGWSKNGKHYGVGHGKGKPTAGTKPSKPAKPVHTKPTHAPHPGGSDTDTVR